MVATYILTKSCEFCLELGENLNFNSLLMFIIEEICVEKNSNPQNLLKRDFPKMFLRFDQNGDFLQIFIEILFKK